MYGPEEIRRELDDYNRPIQDDRSIEDHLDSTDALARWALQKAPQYDPENRWQIPVCIQYQYDFRHDHFSNSI